MKLWYRVRNGCKHIKFAYQRITRGYSDLDWWSVDHFIAETLPPMLRKLAKGYSVPMRFVTEDDTADIDAMSEEYNKYADYLEGWLKEDGWNAEDNERAKEALHWFADHFGEFWD